MKKQLLYMALMPVLPLAAVGQAMITSDVGYTEDFNLGDVDGVKRAIGSPSVGGAISIGEPDNWALGGEQDRYTFNSNYAAASNNGNGYAAPFTSDLNNDSDSDDRMDLQNIAAYVDSSVVDALGPNNAALMKEGNTWADAEMTFRFVNDTGATVDNWMLSLDAYWNDTATGSSTTLSLLAGTSYDPTGAGMTVVDTSISPNTGSGWNAVETLSGNASLSVADGDSLYVQIMYDQESGGNAVAWDNMTAAVPEPSTYAFIAALGALAFAWFRKRR